MIADTRPLVCQVASGFLGGIAAAGTTPTRTTAMANTAAAANDPRFRMRGRWDKKVLRIIVASGAQGSTQ
jgi:hypothetical protein